MMWRNPLRFAPLAHPFTRCARPKMTRFDGYRCLFFFSVPRSIYTKTNMPKFSRKRSRSGAPAGRMQKRRKFTRGKRRFRGKRRGGARMLKTPVTERVFTRFSYVDCLTVDPVTGLVSQLNFVTSLYDPDDTNLGHQPLWRDQFAAMYSKYRVWGMKYSITIMQTASSAATHIAIMHRGAGTSIGSAMVHEMERTNCRHRLLLGWLDGAKSVKGYLNCPKINGMSKGEYAGDEDFEAAMGNNPSKKSSLSILYEGALGMGTPGKLVMRVKITMLCELFGKIFVAGS